MKGLELRAPAADSHGMAVRPARHLPRLVVLGISFLLAAATLTYGAARQLSASKTKPGAPATKPMVVVPDLTGQAFTFAKGTLEDSGFAWQVAGSVHGYAANRVVAQAPAAGTKLIDTGAPTVTVTLARGTYRETGSAEDVSPYYGTAVVPVAQRVRATRVTPAKTVPARTPRSSPVRGSVGGTAPKR